MPSRFHGAVIARDGGRRAPHGSSHRPKKDTAARSDPPTFTIGFLV
jgi:hypothetical protein